jgi:hypothetical protein
MHIISFRNIYRLSLHQSQTKLVSRQDKLIFIRKNMKIFCFVLNKILTTNNQNILKLLIEISLRNLTKMN